MRSKKSDTPHASSAAHDDLTVTTDNLRSAAAQRGVPDDDACYTIETLMKKTGWSRRYLLERTRLPPTDPRHLATIGEGRMQRVPVVVWRAYLRRTDSADTALVLPPSPGYTTPVCRTPQDRAGSPQAPAEHRGRPAKSWRPVGE